MSNHLQKPLVIFIHGGGVGNWMWPEEVQTSSQFDCLPFSLQGHDLNGTVTSFSIQEHAQQLIKTIEQLPANQAVHLVGFSIGAQIALEVLHLTKRPIQSAMINSALISPPHLLKKLTPLLTHLSYPLLKSSSFLALQRKQLQIPQQYAAEYDGLSKQLSKSLLVDMLHENMSFRFPNALKDTTTPVLITVGKKEPKMMHRSAQQLKHNLPNSRFIEINGVGHGFPFIRPREFSILLHHWIRQVK